MLDLNDVALFVQVVQAGSFAEAARRLAMPSNTVSRRVVQLERQLGVRLLQRSTRRLVPTDAGQRFYAQCAGQVEALAQSARELAEGSQQPSGHLRVAAPADFFNWFPMEWIAEFLAAHPRVRLEFVLDDAQADLMGQGIDVAFRTARTLDQSLVARRIGTGRMAMVASAAYLKARGMPDVLEDLLAHDCLSAPSPSGTALWRLSGPAGEQALAVTGRLGANTAQALLKAALAGMGIALLPAMMTAPSIAAGQLSAVLPAYGVEGIGLYLVYLSRHQLPRAVSAFIDFIAAKLQDTGALAGPG